MKKLAYLFSLLLPWKLRRPLLCRLWGFKLHPTSRIGLSWVLPSQLNMGPDSRIGHLTVCKNLEMVCLGAHARIGNGNWITGFPLSQDGTSAEPQHFSHRTDRRPALIIGEHAAITHRHIIDCTDEVRIGKFTTFAGYASQILTHSVDIEASRQTCAPVTIGEYCFVGTNCVILGDSKLPDFSVLGAKSLLNKAYKETYFLYGGVPARPLKELSQNLRYFHRQKGFII